MAQNVTSLLLQTPAPQIFSSFVHQDAVEEEQGKEVRNCHQRIHAVGNVPNDAELNDAANKDGEDIAYAIVNDPTWTAEIFDSTLAVVEPAQDGAERKGE